MALGLTVLHVNTSRGERADQFEQFAPVAALVDLRTRPGEVQEVAFAKGGISLHPRRSVRLIGNVVVAAGEICWKIGFSSA